MRSRCCRQHHWDVAALIRTRQQHRTLEIRQHLQLDVRPDRIWQAPRVKLHLLDWGQHTGVRQTGEEGLGVVIN